MNLRRSVRPCLAVLPLLLLMPLGADAATDNGTLTIGRAIIPVPAPGCSTLSGYAGSWFGSYSPTGLSGGKTVSSVYDMAYCGMSGGYTSILVVSGFAQDPGQSWLTSLTCNSATKSGTSAFTFDYGVVGSGVAR